MHGIALLTASIVALATTATAQTVTYYMHESASPVAVPGGVTTFILDENAPVATTPVAAAVSVPKKTTQTFATFIAPTFAAPTAIGLDFDVTVHVSANLSMNNCAFLRAIVQRVDSTGVRTHLGQGILQTTVPQGSSGGTVGFAARTIPVTLGCDRPIEDVTIEAGESIAVTLDITSTCRANRTAYLAYDSTTAPTNAAFAPIGPADPVFLRQCWLKCQIATSKATAKFWSSKNKCATKCQANYRKGLGPQFDCYAPYGGVTLTCITDPLKGAEAKMERSILKACNVPGRCPQCYNNRDCAGFAPDWVQNSEGQVDSFGPGVWCDPSTDTAIGKCQDNTAKALSKQVGATLKCYDKCFSNEIKGLLAPGSCNPFPSDPATATCINTAESKSHLAIDKYCADLGVVPDCFGNPYPDGTAWSNLMNVAMAGNVPVLHCQ